MVLVLVGLLGVGCSRPEEGGATLHVVLRAGPTSRDPLLTFDESSQLVFGNVVQTITGDPLGMRSSSGVVEHWTNPDRSTWLLYLHEGLRFHDGRPVTAWDVAASLQRVRTEASSPLRAFLENVVDVTVESDDTLKIVASGTVNILAQLAFIPVVPGGAPVPPDGLPVGSGPYRVTSWSGHRITLERFDGGPVSKGAPRRADFLIVPDAERQEAAARALRPVLMIAPTEAVLEEAERLGLRRVEVGSLASLYLVCNLRPGRPLASLEARRALAAVCRGRVSPPGGRRWLLADDMVPRSVFGRVAGRFDPRPTWAMPSAVPKASLEFLAIDTLEPVGERLAACLKDAGWSIELVSMSPRQALDAIEAGHFDLAVMGYSCTSGSALELFRFGFSSHGGAEKGTNFSGYRGPRLDALLEEASSSLDPAVQHDLLVKAGDTVVADLPWIPLFDITRAYLASPSVSLPEEPARGIELSRIRVGS